MKTRKIVNKLIFASKVSLFIIITSVFTNAHAEYYMVYPAPCGGGCVDCCKTRVVKHHPVKHHYKKCKHKKVVVHKHYRGCGCRSYGYTAWYINPPSPCGVTAQRVEAPCANCGSWRPDRWRAVDEGYYYTEPDPYYGPSYNPDRTTGDDDPTYDPEMNIDR